MLGLVRVAKSIRCTGSVTAPGSSQMRAYRALNRQLSLTERRVQTRLPRRGRTGEEVNLWRMRRRRGRGRKNNFGEYRRLTSNTVHLKGEMLRRPDRGASKRASKLRNHSLPTQPAVAFPHAVRIGAKKSQARPRPDSLDPVVGARIIEVRHCITSSQCKHRVFDKVNN